MTKLFGYYSGYFKNAKFQLLLVRYWHTILFSYIYWKDKSIASPPLMFSREIYEFFRSSHRRCFMEKTVLKNFGIFTGKLQGFNFIKNRLQHRCFSLNIAKFLRTPISKNMSANGFWFFKTATEQQWAAASVLSLVLSLDKL